MDWTGRAIKQGKKGAIPEHVQPILLRLQLNDTTWLHSVQHDRQLFFQLVGSVTQLQSFALHHHCSWVKGQRGAQQMYRQQAA